jgi:hypothetical protein
MALSPAFLPNVVDDLHCDTLYDRLGDWIGEALDAFHAVKFGTAESAVASAIYDSLVEMRAALDPSIERFAASEAKRRIASLQHDLEGLSAEERAAELSFWRPDQREALAVAEAA